MFRRVFLLIFLFVFNHSFASAQTLQLLNHDGPAFTILYEEPLKRAVNDVADIYPKISADLENKLRIKLKFKPSIILIHADMEFSRMVGGNDLITAFAMPDRNEIVIDYSKMMKTPFNLELTLEHELSHLILHDYIKNNILPKWLDEGICQWVSGGMADIIQFDGKKLLKEAALTDNFLSLSEISRSFPSSSESFRLAYEESRSFVEYLDERFGTEKLLMLLEDMHNGILIESAVIGRLSVNMDELESDWQDSLRGRYTWLVYFSNNLYWLLFAFAALVTFFGYLRLRVRMKTHFKDEDEDGDDLDLYDDREDEEVKPWE